MENVARTIYRYLAALFLVGVVVEFFLAGLGVFRTQKEATKAGTTLTMTAFNHSFDPHLVVGDVLGVVSIALVLVALGGRIGRRAVLTAAALLLLVLVQAALAFAGPPVVRALHPTLGLLVLGLAVQISHRAWRFRRERAIEPTVP